MTIYIYISIYHDSRYRCLTLRHDIHHHKQSEKQAPSVQYSLLHTLNPSSFQPANSPFHKIPSKFQKKKKTERKRVRSILTSSLPRSRAASLNILLFPDLLPQKTQTLLNFPIIGSLFTSKELITIQKSFNKSTLFLYYIAREVLK